MRSFSILALSAFLMAAPFTAQAADRSSALSGNGTLYSIQSGTYGDLFPEGTEATAAQPVLALDVKAPDQPTERLLVDGTGDDATENDVLLIFEDSSDTLYLLWQKSEPAGESSLVLSGFQNDQWLDPIAVAGSSANLPGSSSLAVTRDSFEATVEGDTVIRERTALHLVWNAGDSMAEAEPLYTAMILEDGEFTGYNPIVRLGDLLVDPEAGSVGSPPFPVLTVSPGVDGRAVVVSFTHPVSGHLVTVESRLLPMELGALAVATANRVIEDGRNLSPSEGLSSLAGGVGSSIIDIGYRFHSSLKGYFASKVEAWILDFGNRAPGPGVALESVAGGVGSSIIDIGLRAFGSDGMHREYAAGRLFTVAVSGEGDVPLDRLYEASATPHLIRLYVVSDLPFLEVSSGAVTVATSETGESSIVSWDGEGETIQYRQSTGEAWSETQTLSLGEGLDRDAALKVLRDRVRKR